MEGKEYLQSQKSFNQPLSVSEQSKSIVWLSHMGVMEVTGSDAKKFLQGQCTHDVSSLGIGQAQLGAFCQANGRMVANFFMKSIKEGYQLMLPKSMIDPLMAYLKKYTVFFKVCLENKTDECFVFGRYKHPTMLALTESRGVCFVAKDQLVSYVSTKKLVDLRKWLTADILEGLAWITPKQSNQCIPQQINWHTLGGVNFKKGCYTGQEIIARTQYLGQPKKTLCQYRSIEPIDIARQPLLLGLSHQLCIDQRICGDVWSLSVASDQHLVLLSVVLNKEKAMLCHLSEQPDIQVKKIN